MAASWSSSQYVRVRVSISPETTNKYRLDKGRAKSDNFVDLRFYSWGNPAK
jgi:hypothetical protein